MNDVYVAVSFLTRLRVPVAAHTPDAATLGRCVRWFPLVGGLVGGVTATIALGLAVVLPIELAVAVALALELLLTGAMHEDALADCCDALGGGWTREDVLRILKDSRLGTYGTAALVLGIGMRWMATAELGGVLLVPAVIAAGALARYAVVLHLARFPAAPGRSGTADAMGVTSPLGVAGVSALVLASPMLVLAPVRTLVGCALAYALHRAFGTYVTRRIGGRTGDTVGAVAYLVQLVLLLAFVAQG